MLIGEKIFKGETPPAVMPAHFKPLKLPTTWPRGVPPGVVNVLKIALANNPAGRYDTADEMAKDLPELVANAQTEPSLVPGETGLVAEEIPPDAGLREPAGLDLVSETGAQSAPAQPAPAERDLEETKQVAGQSQPSPTAAPDAAIPPQQLQAQEKTVILFKR